VPLQLVLRELQVQQVLLRQVAVRSQALVPLALWDSSLERTPGHSTQRRSTTNAQHEFEQSNASAPTSKHSSAK
jgi:hypothetical protein